jgi:hypothetical protein
LRWGGASWAVVVAAAQVSNAAANVEGIQACRLFIGSCTILSAGAVARAS